MTPQEAYFKIVKLYNENKDYSFESFGYFINKSGNKEIDGLKEIIIQDATQATEFALYCNERWIEAEEIIKTNPKMASRYFWRLDRKFLKRWEEAEPYILKGSANSVWDYFQSCIRISSSCFPENIWKDAEPVFSKKMSIFHQYVIEAKKTNELYEQKILNDPDNKFKPKYIYDYSSKVLKSRWKEAEHIILKNPDYAAKYCTKFKLPVPEEIHNQIIAEVALTNKNSSFRKKFLEDQTKRKARFLEYLKELIENKSITQDTTVAQLINNG
jgi:hypothetical protein